MITEDQLNINSTETKLLFDIRSEMKKTNELLSTLIDSLCPMRKDIEDKASVEIVAETEIPIIKKPRKPRGTPAKRRTSKTDKPKRGNNKCLD